MSDEFADFDGAVPLPSHRDILDTIAKIETSILIKLDAMSTALTESRKQQHELERHHGIIVSEIATVTKQLIVHDDHFYKINQVLAEIRGLHRTLENGFALLAAGVRHPHE